MNKEQELRNSLAGANLILKKAIKDVEREYKALEDYESKPAVWVPETGTRTYAVGIDGEVVSSYNLLVSCMDTRAVGNCYQTEALAIKAAEYSRVQGLINQACLNVESDYVPDWSDKSQLKWFVCYSHYTCGWVSTLTITEEAAIIYQSTKAKAQQVRNILNDINLKPVGVK